MIINILAILILCLPLSLDAMNNKQLTKYENSHEKKLPDLQQEEINDEDVDLSKENLIEITSKNENKNNKDSHNTSSIYYVSGPSNDHFMWLLCCLSWNNLSHSGHHHHSDFDGCCNSESCHCGPTEGHDCGNCGGGDCGHGPDCGNCNFDCPAGGDCGGGDCGGGGDCTIS